MSVSDRWRRVCGAGLMSVVLSSSMAGVYAGELTETEQLREEVRMLRRQLEALEQRLESQQKKENAAKTDVPRLEQDTAARPETVAPNESGKDSAAVAEPAAPAMTIAEPLAEDTQNTLRGGQSPEQNSATQQTQQQNTQQQNPQTQQQPQGGAQNPQAQQQPQGGQQNPQAQQQPQGNQQNPQAQQTRPPNAPPQTVGQAPKREEKPPEVAPIFQQPGVLTPKGKVVFEPSLQYAYSTNDRVAIVGFTIIPALTIGLIDVRTVNRTTWTAAVTTRYGLTNRSEIELRIPYVYRNDSTISRPIGTGAPADTAFNASGQYLGDIEATMRYQFNDGGLDRPYYIGTLRVKSRTGRDPFEVSTTSIGPTLTNIENELPTGTGFWGVQPGLTVLYPSDPAVFFGSMTYLYNFTRDVGGTFGKVDPGDIFGFNFGMGLALNEKASFSVGYDHAAVQKPKQNGVDTPNARMLQLGTLLLGWSYRLSPRTNMNLSLGIGVTRDAPDLQLTARFPTRY